LSLSHGSELLPFSKHEQQDLVAAGTTHSSLDPMIATDQDDVSITTLPSSSLLLPVHQDVQMHDRKSPLSRESDDIPFPDDILLLEKATPSTAITVVDTKAYGIQAYKALRDRDPYLHHHLGEPPKKKMRSTAAMLFGAAFETVIFTGAVALSAYQLLTGKGRQSQQPQEELIETDETMASPTTRADASPTDVVFAEQPIMVRDF
jgi:hypothetical protein